jgi:hypothetical protein
LPGATSTASTSCRLLRIVAHHGAFLMPVEPLYRSVDVENLMNAFWRSIEVIQPDGIMASAALYKIMRSPPELPVDRTVTG